MKGTKFLTGMLGILAGISLALAIIGCSQLEGPSGQQWAELPAAEEEGATYVGATDDNTPVELLVEGDTYAVTVGGEEVSGGKATKAKDGAWTLQPEDGKPFTAKASAYGLTLAGPITEGLDGEDLHELYPVEAAPQDAADADYSVTLSVSAIHVFPSANAGYTAQSGKSITITNSGSEATGELTLSVSNEHFTLNNETLASIAAGKKAAFSVRPALGLEAGIYTARVTVSGDNVTAGFNVRFTVNNGDGTPDAEDPPDDIKPDYSINLSQTETLVFAEAVAGYAALEPATITVSNTGNKATGRLMIDLSGTDSGAFTRLPATIASIAANGSATFTIVPKTGLAAGTYAATVTVSGSTGISAGFDAGFEVKPEPVYSVGLSQSGTLTFEEAVFGYDARTPQTITITNKGNQPTGALTITLAGDRASSFTLNRTAIEEGLDVDGTADFTVVPKGGLAAGLHTATVSVSGSNGIFAGLNVSFNVIEGTFDIELNVGGTHGSRDAIFGYQALTAQTVDISFPDAIFGYPALTAQTVNVANKGNQPTGDLAVTLAGDNASAFTASSATVSGIAVGEAGSFTVAPIDGLAVGDYSATVTVGNENVAAQTFEVSFAVETVPEYGISVSQPEDFAKKGEGYAAIAPLEIVVRNVGNRATGALTAALADENSDTAGVSGAGAFTLTDAAIGSIAAGGQAVLRAGPRTGLLAGTAGITVYTAKVVVSGGTGESAISESVNLRFTVARNRVVSFNVNGGSPAVPAQTVVHGEAASEPAANSVSKANLRFRHWYANGQPTVPFDFAAPITADTPLNALWEADVTFAFNGGTGSAPAQVVAEGGAAVRPIANPLKTGLRFKNWYRNVTDAAAYDFTTPITGHTVLNAVWEADVRFDLNGGTGMAATQSITEGGKAAEPATPVWAGFTFGGWYTDAAGTTKWEFETNTVSAHRTLYAKWTAVLRTVSFDSRGGTAVPAITGIMQGTTIAAPAAPTKANLRFKGWYRNLADTAKFDFAAPISENITLFAVWEADVTFALNGGTGTAAAQVVAEGGVAVRPSANPSKTNLSFKNWYRNTTDTAAFDFGIAITGHTALNAVWEANVIFNLNGGTGTAPATQVVAEGGKAAAPATNPSRGADWEFDGWYTEAAGTTKWDFAANTVSANRTLYAKWTRLWAVTLNRNGGTGGQDVYKVRNGTVFTPPAITPPATYAFAGWYREAAFTNAVTSITVTADTPIYAKWTPTASTLFDVTFNLNGGFWDEVLDKDVPRSHRAANGTIVNVPTDAPRRVGYAFKGWYYDSALTQAVPKAPSNTVSGFPYRYPVVPSGDTTLYAKWQSMPNVKVSIKSGVMRSTGGGERNTYEYSVPYGGRLIDVPIDIMKAYRYDGVIKDYADYSGHWVAATNGNRIALDFPAVNENRLEYYEYGLAGHDRFYWGDRFYGDYILWGKYKWRAWKSGEPVLSACPPEPGWDKDYP